MTWWWHRRNGRDAARRRAAAEEQLERVIREGDHIDEAAAQLAHLPTDEFLQRMIAAFGKPRHD